MEDKYLNTDATCVLLNISKSTLYSYIGKQKIPHIKLDSKLLFSEKDIIQWLESKKQNVVKKI